jgi:putative transposase
MRQTNHMPILDDTFATRRHLPHLEKRDKTYFVTFSTQLRRELPPKARTVALRCCLHDHQVTYWLDVVVIMPDHVHMVFTPYEEWSLSEILKRVKGNSSRLINLTLGRKGPLWQDESFDRIVRQSEDLQEKCEYIAQNPVRAGLCDNADEYPWLWREWVDGNK